MTGPGVMKTNEGRCPREAEGRRVDVVFRNGQHGADFAADGRHGCRWSLTGHAYDIAKFKVRA